MANPSTDQDSSADRTRERIIDAALGLFAAHGYARTTTRAIAAAAEVNEVTLFRHFGSKKNLFFAVVQRFNTSGFAGTFEQQLTGDYAADIHTMARMQRDEMARSYTVMRLLLCETHEFAALQEAALEGGQSNQDRIAAYFQRQIDAGHVRADLDATVLAYAFDSLFSTAEFFRQTFTTDFMTGIAPDDALEQMVTLFIRGTQRRDGNEQE